MSEASRVAEDQDTALVQGLQTFANTLKEIKEASIEIMRVHPINGLLMMNLLGNIGYTIFAVPNDNGMYVIGQWWGIGKGLPVQVFESKQELMSWVFRQVGRNSGELLNAEVVKELFSAFNFGKLLEALK